MNALAPTLTAASTPVPTPAAGAAATAGTERLVSSDFETFLKMLTTQMQNQDPMNPIESADFAVQLATFSGVEQQVRTNDLLEGLQGRFSAMNMAQLSGWVGMEALAPMPVMFTGLPVTVEAPPPLAADQAFLVATDSAGRQVSREGVPLTTGPLQWAGTGADGLPLPPGVYTLTLESYAGDQRLADTPAQTYAPVREARQADGSVRLLFDGGVSIDAGTVRGVRGAVAGG